MSEFTAQFRTPRHYDVCVTLPDGVSISDMRSDPNSHRVGRIFCDLAALYHENDQVRAALDQYDIVIMTSMTADNMHKPKILFETPKAREARLAYEKESAYGLVSHEDSGAPDGT